MTADPVFIRLGDPVSDARKMLSKHGVGHLPVVDGSRPVGMVSSSDLLRLIFDAGNGEPEVSDALLDMDFSIGQVMSSDLVSVASDQSVRHTATLMREADVHSAVVVDDDGELAGIVTVTDLLGLLLDLL